MSSNVDECKPLLPETPAESFHRGQFIVAMKDTILQPSTAMRHSAELVNNLLASPGEVKPVLCTITDGGPDHNMSHWGMR